MNKLFFLTLIFIPNLVSAQLQEINPITFGGGVDYKNDCSQIRDDRACDSNNMISYYGGTLEKRYGSHKYIDQAVSSVAVKGLYRAYYSTGSTIYKATIMINDGNIYTDTTTTDTGHVWKSKKTGLDKKQNYQFRQWQKYVLITGDSLNNEVLRYDIQSDSVTENFTNDGAVNSAFKTFKYSVFSKNYYLGANVKDLKSGTTFYPQQVQYSLLIDTPTSLSFTSMTVLRRFDVPTPNGEELTGIEEIKDIHIFSPSSISELQFDVLNVGSQDGDQLLTKIVQGFGCITPRTLVNTGRIYIFLSKDGIRYYDPSARQTLSDETKILSENIEPIIKRMLEAGTYKNAHAVWYGKRNWYIFTFEDPLKYPKDKPNSTLICDLNTGEWYPVSNWLPECYANFDNIDDKQEIIYGDTNDGYVYYTDQEKYKNDSRKEIVIDNCDITSKWNNSTSNNLEYVEGTGSVKMSLTYSGYNSSITYMGTINLSEWYDKSKSSSTDKISLKIYSTSVPVISTLRIDLELNTITNTFDTYFTSVTISSASLTAGTSGWTTIEIPLSSFTILDSWIDISSGILPFAESPTFYGIRLYASAISSTVILFDDIRFVMGRECSLNAFRSCKQTGSTPEVNWRQVLIDCEQPSTAKFYIDAYSDFGDFSIRETVNNVYGKDFFVSGYGGKEGIFKLDGNDFTILNSTIAGNSSVFSIRSMVQDDNGYIYGADQYNNRIMKFNSGLVFVSSVGSYGTGGNNFNMPFQMAMNKSNEKANLFVCDFKNHAVKIYDPNTMKFKKSFGTLGNGTTSFFYPTGIAVDDTDAFIVQDASHRLQKWKINNLNFTYKDSVLLNLNTVGNTRLAVDQKYVYVLYGKISEDSLLYSELWLEVRNKSDLKLVTKSRILPDNTSVVNSTYSVMGDFGFNDDFIYVTFTDGLNPKYWTQTSAENWNSGTIGLALDTTTVSGDIAFMSTNVITKTFNYTGAVQSFIVPQNISSITVALWGGRGKTWVPSPHTGGYGGYVFSSVPVTVGTTIYLYIGEDDAEGFNYGATDIRIGGTTLTDRVLVAGAGGNAGAIDGSTGLRGGAGSYPNGKDGLTTGTSNKGEGGTQSAGGNGGTGVTTNGQNGSLGSGGIGGFGSQGLGTGGGGYYGGGGGGYSAGTPGNNGSGGAGSGYSKYGVECSSFITGYNNGKGSATISYVYLNETFTSKVLNTGKGVNSWNTFTVNETLNDGTIEYRLFSDTDTTIDIYNPNTFIASQTITNNSIATIPFNQYVTVSAKFQRNLSTYTPTLHDFTLNFNAGNSLKTYGKYSDQDIMSLMSDVDGGDLVLQPRNYYLQKRLKDGINFPLIKEEKSTNYLFGACGNSMMYKPKRKSIRKDIGIDSQYIQFKFSEDELDNSFKLYKLSPLLIPKPLTEK